MVILPTIPLGVGFVMMMGGFFIGICTGIIMERWNRE